MASHETFLTQFLAAQSTLRAYVRSHGYGPADTDDILQSAALELWKSYANYDPSRPFSAWAFVITRNLISKRRRSSKVLRMTVSSELCDTIADRVAPALVEHERRFAAEREHLADCLQKLGQDARSMLALKYNENLDLATIAARTGKGMAAVNMVLSRLRAKLLDCISLKKARAQ